VQHHLRHTHKAEQSIVVYGQQYSLLQQLIQQDPCFFPALFDGRARLVVDTGPCIIPTPRNDRHVFRAT
jgi:hypothetical protein